MASSTLENVFMEESRALREQFARGEVGAIA